MGADFQDVFARVGVRLLVENANHFIDQLAIGALPTTNCSTTAMQLGRTLKELPAYAFCGRSGHANHANAAPTQRRGQCHDCLLRRHYLMESLLHFSKDQATASRARTSIIAVRPILAYEPLLPDADYVAGEPVQS